MDANRVISDVYDQNALALRTTGPGASGGTAAAQGTLTNRSGTITVGGTAQTAMAANTSRRYLLIRNPATETEPLYFNFTTTAVVTGQPSITLQPGEGFVMENSFISTELISVVAATTGHKFVAKEG